jgi:3-phenylpropionate/trans-cinnamate dioxygenase ferredoxin subunit
MTTLAFDDLVPGRPVAVEVDGKPVCVARVGDEVFAVSNICSHSYAELSEGEVKNFSIECWLHGADFDLRTGEALTLPATEPLETFLVARDGNEITITQGTKEN